MELPDSDAIQKEVDIDWNPSSDLAQYFCTSQNELIAVSDQSGAASSSANHWKWRKYCATSRATSLFTIRLFSDWVKSLDSLPIRAVGLAVPFACKRVCTACLPIATEISGAVDFGSHR